jgi:hypothetical protein
MLKLVVLGIFVSISVSCNSQNCKSLPDKFPSYSEAISLVKSSSFAIKEDVNTSNSSWITSAKYYSCDGRNGYFIYTSTNGQEYIHSGVPRYIWDGFKSAESKGNYYNSRIKGRYQLQLKY